MGQTPSAEAIDARSQREPVRPPALGNALSHRIAIIAALFIIHLGIGITQPFTVESDGDEYVRMAESLRIRGTFSYDGVNPVIGKPPGISLLIAVWLSAVGSLTGFHVFQLLSLFVGFLCVALIAGRLAGPWTALAVLTVLVFLWPLKRLAQGPLSEPVFIMLSMAGICLLIRVWSGGGFIPGAVTGLLFGTATYMRPITLFLPFFILAFALALRSRWRRYAIVLAAAHVLVVAPWIVRNAVLFDRAIPMVANWGPLYYITDEALWKIYFYKGTQVIRASEEYREMTLDEFQFNWRPAERFRRAALDNIIADPGGYLRRCVRQAIFAWTYLPGTKGLHSTAPGWFWFGRGLMILFYTSVVLGIRTLWNSNKTEISMVVGHSVYTAAVLFPVCTESRYLLPAYMLLLPLAVVGLHRAVRLLRFRERSQG